MISPANKQLTSPYPLINTRHDLIHHMGSDMDLSRFGNGNIVHGIVTAMRAVFMEYGNMPDYE